MNSLENLKIYISDVLGTYVHKYVKLLRKSEHLKRVFFWFKFIWSLNEGPQHQNLGIWFDVINMDWGKNEMNMVHKLQQNFFFSFKSQMLFENIRLDNWKGISFYLICWRHDNMSRFFGRVNCTEPLTKVGY